MDIYLLYLFICRLVDCRPRCAVSTLNALERSYDSAVALRFDAEALDRMLHSELSYCLAEIVLLAVFMMFSQLVFISQDE